MAWWTHILFSGRDSEEYTEENKQSEHVFAVFRRAVRDYLYEHLIDILYFLLGFFTYLYLIIAAITFFFEENVPKYFPDIIETLAEPYLGTIGVYIIVKEIERRRGRRIHRLQRGDVFTFLWLTFMISATFFTYFSEHYHWSSLYKTIVTNALAATIIRIGAMIR